MAMMALLRSAGRLDLRGRIFSSRSSLGNFCRQERFVSSDSTSGFRNSDGLGDAAKSKDKFCTICGRMTSSVEKESFKKLEEAIEDLKKMQTVTTGNWWKYRWFLLAFVLLVVIPIAKVVSICLLVLGVVLATAVIEMFNGKT